MNRHNRRAITTISVYVAKQLGTSTEVIDAIEFEALLLAKEGKLSKPLLLKKVMERLEKKNV